MQFATLLLIASAVLAMPGGKSSKATKPPKEYQNGGTIQEISEECMKGVSVEFKANRRKFGCAQVHRHIKHGSKDEPAMIHVENSPRILEPTKEFYKPASKKH